MGDKHRSEIQKPVKNTLLSGASHGFPFETFQGSSLLIPVSQDSPSVLNDNDTNITKSDEKGLTHSENLTELTEAVGMTTLGGATLSNESKNLPPTASQGYTGLFSSFFGGPRKPESEPSEEEKKNTDQPSVPPLPPQSSSPFAPSVQCFSPVLQVPTASSDHTQNDSLSHSTGASMNSSFPPPQGLPQSQFDTFSAPSANSPAPPHFSQPNTAAAAFPGGNSSEFLKDFGESEQNVQKFFNKDNESGPNLGFVVPSTSTDIGFESFYNSGPPTASSVMGLTKAQSAIDLIRGSSNEHSSSVPPQFPNSVQQPASGASQFYQMRTGSADSIAPLQPPPMGVPASLSSPFTAPPMSSGSATRNYRRDHHKRLAYAPVPGLTSNTAVSSSYLQPCENFSTPMSMSSSALTSSSGVLKPPLSGSLSQPAMNISDMSSGSLLGTNSSTSNSSLQNFFPSAGSQSPFQSVESLTSDTTVSRKSSFTNSQSFPPLVTPRSQASPVPVAPPPTMGSTYTVSSHVVHPPIMSTREQTIPLIPTSSADRSPSPVIIPASLNNLANLGTSGIIYRPVYHHWFIRYETKDSKEIWQPFSMTDSLALEQAFNSDTLTPSTVVATDGGRYDVNITNRIRTAVYWEEEPKMVRRCSWFYKITTESRLRPYDENIAYNLEEEYKKAVTTNTWNRKVDLLSGDYVLMYGPNSMGLYQSTPETPEGWEAEQDYSQAEQRRPKIVKRGVLDDFDIDEGESPTVDHLIFVVHGIGAVCDFKFRTIEEAGLYTIYGLHFWPGALDTGKQCKVWPMLTGDELVEFLLENTKRWKVDGFRAKSLQLVKSHFRSAVDEGVVNRVEVLPVSWHNHLHGENTGVDKKLQTITLKSIPRLRHFTNDTLLDILFYTSPVYCQNIVQQVGREVNTLYEKFKTRNPTFKGGVSLVGHSLGSLIVFDMLCHQKPPSPRMQNIKEESKATVVQHDVTTIVSPDKKKRSLSRNVSYVIGNAGTGQPFIEYPQLSFQPLSFFALGSPIGMFVTVRGIDSLGLEFCLPTCSRFFNVFHPFDPVAYRIEALINPDLADKRPVLIPHHKGRKRMHLELKETMARVGADLKQRLVDSVRSTWNTVYQLTMFGRADDGLEQEVDKVIEKQLERQRTESVGNGMHECEETDFNAGRLNQGRRIDYVLQEAPLESFNEYVSALTSHVIYWDSEDTILLILKEIYGSLGISTDNQHSIPGMQEPSSPSTSDPGNVCSTSAGPSHGFK